MTYSKLTIGFASISLGFIILLTSVMSISDIYAKVIEFIDTSGEMSPAIPYNSTIKIDTNGSQFYNLKVGDIIAFQTPSEDDENKTVVHRISAIIEQGNNLKGEPILCSPIPIDEVIQERTLLTKGDDNSCSLPDVDFPITIKEYVGKVTSVVITRNMY